MTRLLGCILALGLAALPPVWAGDDAKPLIADLSAQLRVDLKAKQHSVRRGEGITLVAKLNNVGSAPVVVRPVELFGYINWSYSLKPNDLPGDDAPVIGAVGQVIREGMPGDNPQGMVLLEPGRRVTRRTVFQPQASESPGTLVYEVSVRYCDFYGGTLAGVRVLEGCVTSNKVKVEVEP
jgi:hypothetical protein